MPDRQVAAPAAPREKDPGMAVTGRRSRWAVAGQLLSSRPVRWGFVAVTVGLGGYAVAREWPGVRSGLASIGPGTSAEALLCVLAAVVLTMQVWRVLLAGLGSPLPHRAASRIMFIGQLGKYLPGSVWPVLAQMELGNAYRVPRHRSATASALAMVVSLLTGLLTALATLPFVAGANAYRWAFAITPVLLACLHPRVLNALVGRLLRLTRRPPLEQPLSGRSMAAALAWSWAAWVFYGLQIWLLATRLGAPPGRTVLIALGGFAFAWSVGFVVVLAPAGAGVRDVLLIATLSPVLGTGPATAVALMSRVLMTVADLLTAGLAAVSSRPPGPRTPSPGSPESGQ
jgi:glycosyltransferase 2 family protein